MAGDHSILGAVSRVLTEHTTRAATGSRAVIAPALLLGGVLVLLSAGAIQRLGTRDRLNEWIGYGLARRCCLCSCPSPGSTTGS